MKADESGYGISLSGAYLCCVDELSCHEFGLPFYSAMLGSAFHHVAKVLLFLGGEVVCLKMIIDDDELLAVYIEKKGYGEVAFRLIFYLLMPYDGVLTE